MTRIRIEEDPDRPGEGCARLLLPGFAGRSAAAVTFTREGFGTDSLGPDGWQVAAGRLTPIDVASEGDALVLVLGPEAAEHLEPGPVRLGIPALGIDQVVVWPGIAPPLADRRGGFAGLRPAARAPRRAPARVARSSAAPDPDATVVLRPPPMDPPEPLLARPPRPPAPEAEAAEVKPPGKRRRRGWLVLVLLLLLLALGAGAGTAWWLGLLPPLALPGPSAFGPLPGPTPIAPTPAPEDRMPDARPPEARPPAPPADPTETASPAEIAAMGLPPDRITEIARRRQATNRPQDALLLFEFAAGEGHGPALAALARLYDPASFTPGGALSAPNALKAAEYWRAAERAGEAGAAAPRAVLRQRLEDAARTGDPLAALALRDFWP